MIKDKLWDRESPQKGRQSTSSYLISVLDRGNAVGHASLPSSGGAGTVVSSSLDTSVIVGVYASIRTPLSNSRAI